MQYTVQATVVSAGEHSGDSSRSLPTFILDSHIQGIVSADHAKRIAQDIVAPFGGITADISVAESACPDRGSARDALVAYLTEQIVADNTKGHTAWTAGFYEQAAIMWAREQGYRHSLGAFLLAETGRTTFTHWECVNAVASLAHRTQNYALLGERK